MKIETFIFLDLETTGLPSEDHVPKVTELAFLCVLRSDIEKADINNLPPVSKLTYLFNPQTKLSLEAAEITGLSNEFLINQPAFRDKIKCINTFLDAPKPVCLIAHSGNIFDFKILKNEFANAYAVLPGGLYCVDSFKAFKQILQDNVFTQFQALNKQPKMSLKLTNIYKTLLRKEPIESHRAEADCMMLLECVISTKQYFLPWADKNYQLLSSIRPF